MRARGARRSRRWLALAALVATGSLFAQLGITATAAVPEAPPPLSPQGGNLDVASSYGSGDFGSWVVDRFGLPAYNYTVDEQTDPIARQPELAGSTSAWSQVGNDRVVANAYNHGYVQLWSQDRLYQWMNYYDATSDHFAGGFGYLNVGGRVVSTLYDDRPAGSETERVFGMGYFAKQLTIPGLEESDTVYAPFGKDPVLLHDVTITDRSKTPLSGSYVEYWDVDPQLQDVVTSPRGYTAPTYDPATRTLEVTQLPDLTDTRPLSIFAAALDAPVTGYDADTSAFFGSGGRARPAAVVAGHLDGAMAPADPNGVVGKAMFAFQSPFQLGPGQSVTFRYAYGYGYPGQIAAMVGRYSKATHPLAASEAAWRAWLPKASFGPAYRWLSRELEWDAYMVRSDATYDGMCGYYILSQGGYYQYYFGENEAYRDPLQIMLPMIEADPWLARQVIEYSAHEQLPGVGAVPYGIASGCTRFDLGTSDDLDLWLLWGTADYVLTTRDFGFLERQVPYYKGTATGTVLQHLEVAFVHQEDIVGRGPHGEYLTGLTGDWNDFSTEFLQMTESDLVTAQAAYVYPLLAEAVARAGVPTFAAQLRAAAARDLAVVRGQFVADRLDSSYGWFARGYSGAVQIGAGEMFEEPQPWALLAGAAAPAQATKVVAAFRRFLEGIGAPAAVHGPSPIGASMTPCRCDPGITEQSEPGINNSAGWPGGTWFDLNGWMVWALADLQGTVPGAASDAWYEFLHDTLAAHATAYPDHWDGLITVDDECASFYSPTPANCGIGLTTAYDTQIPNQAAYGLFDLVQLSGLTPATSGYTVDPHLPTASFTVRFPLYGLARSPGLLRGYLRPVAGGPVVMKVAVPAGSSPARAVTWVDGRPVPHTLEGDFVVFEMTTAAGSTTTWAVS